MAGAASAFGVWRGPQLIFSSWYERPCGGNGVKDTGIATYQICHLITVFASWECNAGSNSATVQYIPQLHPANMASPSLFSCTHLRLSTIPSAGHGAGPQWEVVHRSSRFLPEWNCADSGWRDELGRTASVGFDGVWWVESTRPAIQLNVNPIGVTQVTMKVW